MGFFPTDAIDQDEVGPNANGSFFKYIAADDKWILIPNADVYTEAEVDALLHPQSHDNTYHTTNYHTEAAGTGVVTIHSDMTSAGSGAIITVGERTALHPAAHVLATTGPHTGELPLGDLATGVAGSIIIRGASDWQELAKGTSTYVLKMGATYPAWGQVAWGEVTGKPTEFTPISHNNTYHSTNYHTETDGIGVVTIHSDITSAGSGIIITAGERTALHPIVTAGDLNHNDLANINAGDSYEHLTLTEKNLIGDAYKIEGADIDTTGIADTKILKYNGTTWVIADDSTGGAGADIDAIHDNVDGEIVVIIEKTVPTTTDEIIIEDAAASNAKKSVKLGNIDIAGDVTGTLGVTVVGNDSHSHNTQYYTEAEINDRLHIGTGNKEYAQLIQTGFYIAEYGRMYQALANYSNVGSGDFVIFFTTGLPLTMGSLHLHVDYVYCYLYDADTGDYINNLTVYGKTSATTTTLYDNAANQTTTGLKSYPTGVDDWGDYDNVRVSINVVATNAQEWEMSTIRIRYWYA